LDWLQDVLSGRMAASGVPQSTYDPGRSFAQNALDPQGIENAMGLGMGFSGGGMGTRPVGGWGGRLSEALKAGDVTAPRSVLEAKYIMPDGRLIGAGDQTHEYIAHLLGYGVRGEDSVAAMMGDTGATRVNIADALFDKAAPAVDLAHPPTPQQMSRLDSYLKQRGGADVAYRDQYGRAERGSDVLRMIQGLLE
jgi:hypothetical protein